MQRSTQKTSPFMLIASAFVLFALAFVLAGCGGQSSASSQSSSSASSSSKTEAKTEAKTEDKASTPATSSSASSKSDDPYATGIHHARIEVANYGTIEVELNASIAPITVSNFAKLVNEKFYDGLTFHRIISGFMIQGGDPKGNGTGGSTQTIEGEFDANGHFNPITHTRGTISMARSQDYNSASSQFFIMHQTSSSLDGQYAAFGHVTKGMEVVDKIAEDAKPSDSNGTIPKEQQPVISSITMID